MTNPWTISHRADLPARLIADRHYNRQKPGSHQFVPPGRCVVLLLESHDAVWVTSWPFAQYVKHAWAGAWVNSLFRNESLHLSSWLVQQAILKTLEVWPEPPELGMITFVDAGKIRRKRDPGRCYRKAGFSHVGFTKGGLYALQFLPQQIKQLRGITVVDFKGGIIPPSITEFGEGAPTTLVTEGNYLLTLTDIQAGMNRTTGDGFVSIRTLIADGPVGLPPEGAGKPLWTIQNPFLPDDPSKSRAWAFGQMLAAIGLPMETIASLGGKQYAAGPAGYQQFQAICQALTQALKGRKFGAVVTTYNGSQGAVSQIARPFSAADFENQKAVAGTRPAAQPSSAPAPANGAAAAQVSDQALQEQLGALLQPAAPAAV